jgi:hypothetical protein
LSVGDTSVCRRKDCDNSFTKKTHNQVYCSDECCRIATNDKIMERYHERKRRRSGKPRKCAECSVKLSRYNLGDICSKCLAKSEVDDVISIKSRMENVVWE